MIDQQYSSRTKSHHWQVLEAYQAGVTSLKNVAIDIDKVDQTMDQLEEVSI